MRLNAQGRQDDAEGHGLHRDTLEVDSWLRTQSLPEGEHTPWILWLLTQIAYAILPLVLLAQTKKKSWRSPVGAPVTRASDLRQRHWELALGEFAVLTPTVLFPIALRRF